MTEAKLRLEQHRLEFGYNQSATAKRNNGRSEYSPKQFAALQEKRAKDMSLSVEQRDKAKGLVAAISLQRGENYVERHFTMSVK